MPQISRPTKQGGATTYQGKVGAGYTNILASEMDADLDTIYSAWNTGVGNDNIADGSITGSKLVPGAVGSRELADGGVATVDLADGAVTTPKIADGAVTTPKIVDGSITGAKIADGTIGTVDVADGAITQAKLSGPITPSSAAGGSLTGNYPNPTIANGAVVDAMIASVAYGKVTGHPTSYAPSGAAGGALNGSYPNPGVNAIASSGLVAGATVRQFVTIAMTAGWSPAQSGSWTLMAPSATMTTRGGFVLIVGNIAGYFRASTTATDVWLGIARNGSIIYQWRYGMQAPSGNPAYPMGIIAALDQPPAGAYNYAFGAMPANAALGNFFTTGSDCGILWCIELS